jgi:hypothetical protein
MRAWDITGATLAWSAVCAGAKHGERAPPSTEDRDARVLPVQRWGEYHSVRIKSLSGHIH